MDSALKRSEHFDGFRGDCDLIPALLVSVSSVALVLVIESFLL